MGLIFLQVFRLSCHWNVYCYLFMMQVRKVVANGVVFLTFGAIAFGAI